MNRQIVAEFHGGPLDGTRRLQTELPSVYVEPLKDPVTMSSTTGSAASRRTMVYVLRGDSTAGRAESDVTGLYQYDFRGYRGMG